MKICCISDTHNLHEHVKLQNLKNIDAIVHCGDFTNKGTFKEIKCFIDWFISLPVKHKILIAGNHEITLDCDRYNKNKNEYHPLPEMQINSDMCYTYIVNAHKQGKLYYLENKPIVIDDITFYGSPFSLEPDYNPSWGFQHNDTILDQVWSAIPDDIDVLLTHTPPYNVLDNSPFGHKGSKSLYDHVKSRVKPALHVFGHIHNAHGYKVDDDTIFVNATVVDGKRNVKYEPIIIEI